MTTPRMEFTADTNLKRQGFLTWLPHQRIRTRRKAPHRDHYRIEWKNEPYFPRYMFVAIRAPSDSLYDINETDGVSTVVNCGDEPLPIPNEVMTELMDRADNGGLVGTIDKTARQRYASGTQVKFTDESPFCSFVALVDVDIGPNVRVWLDVLGVKRSIPVHPDSIVATG